MEHQNLKQNIEILVERELEHARSRFNEFNSSHEGYAVILEEFEELQEEITSFEQKLQSLWNSVKSNDNSIQYENIKLMENISKQIIKEGIQLGAMCRRYHEDVVKE
jgi:uncharacterized protein YydD (DUF2326 family)